MLVAAKLEAQEKHDDCRTHQYEAGEIKGPDGCSKDLQRRQFRFWLGDLIEEEEAADDGSEGEVDIEAWNC